MVSEYSARTRCDYKGWAEAKVPFKSVPSIFTKDVIARIQQRELTMHTEMAKKPTRRFHW